jgi:uncharacterized membrane protein
MTDSVRNSIEIDAPANDVFAVATDFASYPEWNSNIKKVEVRERDDSGRPTKVWMEVDAKLKTISYTLGYDYSDAPRAFSWWLEDGDVTELKGSYAFDQSATSLGRPTKCESIPASSFPRCCAARPRDRSRAPRWKV